MASAFIESGMPGHFIATLSIRTDNKLQAKDVSQNTNHTQAAERAVRATEQTRFPCEFSPNQLSGSRDISYTNKNH